MLTENNLVIEKPHSLGGGVQRLYRVGNWGLSLVNAPILHSYSFAWEAAVLKFDEDGLFSLCYDTPLTCDVEVFDSDEEANDFIHNACEWFSKNGEF